jgi:signal peptidase I
MPINIAMAVLFLMVAMRLVVHLKPSLLDRFSKLQRARWLEGWDSVVGALLGALLLVKFVIRPFYIPSGSMEPTFLVNDRILVNSFMYNFTQPNRGDIVVFVPPPEAARPASESEIILIKRVVAVAHDRVEVKDGKLFLNDVELTEPFTNGPISGTYGPETVKEGHIFVMGDNRNNSRDSRFIGEGHGNGQIPLANVMGRAECIFFPLGRMTLFNFPDLGSIGRAAPVPAVEKAPVP